MVVDALGRTTKLTDPNGNETYTVYKDADHEVRTYRGWTGSATTGPTEVCREDRGRKYTESADDVGHAGDEQRHADGDGVDRQRREPQPRPLSTTPGR